jgi:hypothetical protein
MGGAVVKEAVVVKAGMRRVGAAEVEETVAVQGGVIAEAVDVMMQEVEVR